MPVRYGINTMKINAINNNNKMTREKKTAKFQSRVKIHMQVEVRLPLFGLSYTHTQSLRNINNQYHFIHK